MGCRLRMLCLPGGLAEEDIAVLEAAIESRVTLEPGDCLYADGDRFTALYAVLAGAIKTGSGRPDIGMNITGCFLPGELFGFSGISEERYLETAIALRPSVVCELPFGELQALCLEVPGLQSRLLHLMSQRIVSYHELIGHLVDRSPALSRLAAFLLGLSSRAVHCGEAASPVELPMSNADLGNYLGMRHETVSRLLSRLAAEKIIRRDDRVVTILDSERLRSPVCSNVQQATPR